jgi:Sulfatase
LALDDDKQIVQHGSFRDRLRDLANGLAACRQCAGEAARSTVLPIPDPSYSPITELDARNATPPPRFEVKAPAKAPNVLIILLDDMGFGQPSTFGGPIHMPTLDRLSAQGSGTTSFTSRRFARPRAPRYSQAATIT